MAKNLQKSVYLAWPYGDLIIVNNDHREGGSKPRDAGMLRRDPHRATGRDSERRENKYVIKLAGGVVSRD